MKKQRKKSKVSRTLFKREDCFVCKGTGVAPVIRDLLARSPRDNAEYEQLLSLQPKRPCGYCEEKDNA